MEIPSLTELISKADCATTDIGQKVSIFLFKKIDPTTVKVVKYGLYACGGLVVLGGAYVVYSILKP